MPYGFDKTGRNQLIGLKDILADKWFKNNSGLSIKHSATIYKHFFITTRKDLDILIPGQSLVSD